MPALANYRHEAFCLEITGGMPPKLAYWEAGYARSNKDRGTKLLKQPHIQVRLAELAAVGGATCVELAVHRLSKIIMRTRRQDSAAALSVERATVVDITRLNAAIDTGAPALGSGRVVVLSDRPMSEDEWQALHRPE